MLEPLRRQRRLTLGVLGTFVLVLLVAMLASAPTRQVVLPEEICTTQGADALALALHDGHGMDQGDGAEAAPHHHADPACVLCLAWSAPPVAVAMDYRPPSPHAARLWWAPQVPRAQRSASAPPPLRGPPPSARA